MIIEIFIEFIDKILELNIANFKIWEILIAITSITIIFNLIYALGHKKNI